MIIKLTIFLSLTNSLQSIRRIVNYRTADVAAVNQLLDPSNITDIIKTLNLSKACFMNLLKKFSL